MKSNRNNQNSEKGGEIIIYSTPGGNLKVEVTFQDENFWLSQKGIAELFGSERSVITKHLRNIFSSGELLETAVSAKFAHTAADGKNYLTAFYNLDAVLAVGCRVNSA